MGTANSVVDGNATEGKTSIFHAIKLLETVSVVSAANSVAS